MPYSTNCLTLIYNEDLTSWLPPASYRAQALLAVPGRGLYSLPLPGQAATPAGGYSLWAHRALPAEGPAAQLAGAYGVAQSCWLEFVVLGAGPDTTKLLDNLVLVGSQGPDPVSLRVSTSEQPGQTFALRGATADITARNLTRSEGHTYITVPGRARGEKHRGRWLKVRLDWQVDAQRSSASQQQSRLLKVVSLVRDSFR